MPYHTVHTVHSSICFAMSGWIRTDLTLRIAILGIHILTTFLLFLEMCWMLDIWIHAGGVLVWTDAWQMHIDAYGSIQMHTHASEGPTLFRPTLFLGPTWFSGPPRSFYNCHFCLVCWGFVFIMPLSMGFVSYVGAFSPTFFCPNYIPTQNTCWIY